MIKIRFIVLLCFLIAISVAVILHGTARPPDIVHRTAFIMGTIAEIKVPVEHGMSRQEIETAIDNAFNEMRRIEGIFSVYRADSEISAINALQAGQALKVSEETIQLIKKSVELSRATGGAFDITVKPLVELWATAKAGGLFPSESEVRRTLERVGYRHIIIDDQAKSIAFDRGGITLDMGGVAKGYATDRAMQQLSRSGIAAAIVKLGGNTYCRGGRSEHHAWRVGIRHPRRKDEMFLELELRDAAIDTAGDYEKYFIFGGKRYSHIVDPRTGYPIGDGVVSASIITSSALTADALATAACVLGPEKIKELKVFDDVGVITVQNRSGTLTAETNVIFRKSCNVIKETEL